MKILLDTDTCIHLIRRQPAEMPQWVKTLLAG